MAYRIGHCAQCDTRIMVQDTNGRWNAFRASFRQSEFVFPDGHKMKVPLCEDCVASPDKALILSNIVAEGSHAANKTTRNFLNNKGTPASAKEIQERPARI